MSAKPPRPGMICHHMTIRRDGTVERMWRDPPKQCREPEFVARTRRGAMATEAAEQATLI